MPTYGLTDAGFVLKPFATIVDELEAAHRAKQGASIDTSPESVLGQHIGIYAERELAIWELAQALWTARSQSGAGGVSQDRLYELTGSVREAPRKSTVTTTWSGTNGTVIPAGRVVSVSGNPEARFVTLADATVASGTATVEMESEEYGPVVANAGTLTVIETPVGGITAVTNALDADLGAAEETDAAFRLRQADEVRGDGLSAPEAIRAHVLQVDGVVAVTVFHNPSDVTDVDGLPPHSVEVMVQGGEDQDIWDALWESVAAGIYTHGDEVGTVEDEQGDTQTLRFTRPDEEPIKVELTYSKTSDYPVGGDDQVKEAVVAFAESRYQVGMDVTLSSLAGAVWQVPGIYDVTLVRGSIHPAAFGTINIVIGSRALATFDTSRVTLITSTVTPP